MPPSTILLCFTMFATLASPPAKSSSPPGGAPSASASAVAAQATPFPGIDGWKFSDGPTTYDSDTLFEYIDGAAPAFLAADFEELSSVTYANPRGVEVTVEVYRHQSAPRAFGMYTQERPAGTTVIPVGIEGYGGTDYLHFVVGSYYVKLRKHGAENVSLRSFAEKVAARLPGVREAPAILRSFPARGKLPRAERMTAHDFLGYSFFHDAVAVPYEVDGARFRLFVIRGRDEAELREMLRRYLAQTKSADSEIRPAGSAELKDRQNGPVDVRWRGAWLWGAVDDPSPMRKALVEELGRALPTVP